MGDDDVGDARSSFANGYSRLNIRQRARRSGLGRRRSDYDMRTTLTKQWVIAIVVLVDLFYLAGQALLVKAGLL
jgi:hypothetical protein